MLNPSQRDGRKAVDYNLHGLVGIRLVDAAPADTAAVTRQLGPIQASLTGEPDIVIHFVDQLPLSSPLRYLGVDEVGFTDDAFLVLRGKHKSQARVQIPLHQVGNGCEIVCQRGLSAVPLLIPILNLTMLAKGALALHASALVHEGTGVLATGWSKGGKTETLLAFMSQGARYVGDEWVYLKESGQMFGIPQPIRLWDWHLRQLPHYRRRLRPGALARLHAIRLARFLVEAATNRRATRISALLKQQQHVDVPPQQLFGKLGPLTGSFDRLLFLVSHESPEIAVRPIAPQEVASRMAFSLHEERMNFMSYYWKFRFAFPNLGNPWIDYADKWEGELLSRVLEGKRAYAVYHPYPMKLAALFDALYPLCCEGDRGLDGPRRPHVLRESPSGAASPGVPRPPHGDWGRP